jgi:hypothetical protein
MANVVVVVNHVTLDGAMQVPGRPNEDTPGEFTYGDWAIRGNDEVMGRKRAGGTAKSGSPLLGRRTYDDLYGFWPSQTSSPFTEVFNHAPKYVTSLMLREPLSWSTSILLGGEAADAAPVRREAPAHGAARDRGLVLVAGVVANGRSRQPDRPPFVGPAAVRVGPVSPTCSWSG